MQVYFLFFAPSTTNNQTNILKDPAAPPQPSNSVYTGINYLLLTPFASLRHFL